MSSTLAHSMQPSGGPGTLLYPVIFPQAAPRMGMGPAPMPQTPMPAPMPAPYPAPYLPPAPPPAGFAMPGGPVNTPAGPLAQSFPMGPAPQLPTPDQLAPCLFNTHYHNGYGPTAPNGGAIYNYNQAPYYPWGYPQQMPPQMPPTQALPPTTEKPAEKPAEPPATPPAKPVPEVSALTPQAVREIQQGLSDGDSQVRMQAASRLSKIFDSSPNLLSDPNTAKYAEALVLKVLRDPMSTVRFPLIMSMQLGNVQAPTQAIMSALKTLQSQDGMYGFERGDIVKIVEGYKNGTLAPSEIKPAALEQGGNPSVDMSQLALQTQSQKNNANGNQAALMAALAKQQQGLGQQDPVSQTPAAAPMMPGQPMMPPMGPTPQMMFPPAKPAFPPGMMMPPAYQQMAGPPGQRLNMMSGGR